MQQTVYSVTETLNLKKRRWWGRAGGANECPGRKRKVEEIFFCLLLVYSGCFRIPPDDDVAVA